MARLVVKTAHGPHELKPQKHSAFICMCGLSKNQPFCDSSHKRTLDEKDDTVYMYDPKTGKRVEEGDDEECCGGGTCGCCENSGEKK